MCQSQGQVKEISERIKIGFMCLSKTASTPNSVDSWASLPKPSAQEMVEKEDVEKWG